LAGQFWQTPPELKGASFAPDINFVGYRFERLVVAFYSFIVLPVEYFSRLDIVMFS
jgi:hypothetical protein